MDAERERAEVVAATLRAERAARRLSQNEIAKRAGIPRPTFVRYESGERRINVAQAIATAEALGMTFPELAQRIDERLKRATRPATTAPTVLELAADHTTQPLDRDRWEAENEHDDPA
ncbi:MAG: helix-turn-helix transcriptional regulator [Propionibacteriaceae bacterium]|nr:helix-turn-helix transcriptional regulator [Propionibacteriaceae bacterium]